MRSSSFRKAGGAGKNPKAYLQADDNQQTEISKQYNAANQPLDAKKAISVKKRKSSTSAIPEGHWPLPSDQPMRSYPYYIAPPNDQKGLLSTPEGQAELERFIAITNQQKQIHKELKAKRNQYNAFLQQQREIELEKEKKKLEKKKRKLEEKKEESKKIGDAKTKMIIDSITNDASEKSNESGVTHTDDAKTQ